MGLQLRSGSGGSGSGSTVQHNGATVANPNFVDVTLADLVALGVVPKTLVDAKGDLIAASADDTVGRLPVGADGFVLTADAASTFGVKWAAATGGGGGGSLTATQIRDITMPFRGSGVLARTFDPALASGSVAPSSGVPRFHGAVKLYSGDVVSNIVLTTSTTTAGSGITESRVFLVDGSGVILARSGDFGVATWAVSTERTYALLSAYTASADMTAYVVSATTQSAGAMPTLLGSPGASTGATAGTGRDPKAWGGNGLTTYTAGSFPAVGATIAFPTTKAVLAYAHLT